MSEWLTDKEKRILFSALTREKSVCIQVDKQCEPREPYEQSLQSVCESLEHKFYYDRLFKKMEKKIRAKAIDDAKSVILQTLDNEILVDTLHLRLEQLKAGGNIELSEYSKSKGNRTGKQKATIEAEPKTERQKRNIFLTPRR